MTRRRATDAAIGINGERVVVGTGGLADMGDTVADLFLE